jgi:3-mercaptopyruvate sulfurtransferase SseA
MLVPLALACLACSETKAPSPAPVEAGPAPLGGVAQRSSANRADNRAGLVTRETLEAWLADWPANRPEGITGDLVILQPDDAEGPLTYVAQAPGVRAYHAPDLPLLLQARNNGVLAISRVPGNGVRVDSYLRRYGIRHDRDLVVFLAGKRSVATLADLTRAWLTLRSWGLPHRSLAVVDASVSELDAAFRSEASIPPPIANDDVRVPSLERPYFELVAHLGDVRDAVEEQAPLLDSRPLDEFEGKRLAASALDETCLAGSPECTPTYSGRILGAQHFPVERVLDPTTFAFRPLSELDSAFALTGAVPIVYDHDGASSAVVTFAALAVAGVPMRWYAASFLEWASLNASHPVPELRTLPEASPWRTDVPALSEGERQWATTERSVRPLVFDPASESAERSRLEDLEYLEDPTPLPAPGVGDSSCLR